MGTCYRFADLEGKHLLDIGKINNDEVPDGIYHGPLTVERMEKILLSAPHIHEWGFTLAWQKSVCEGRPIGFYSEYREDEEDCPWQGEWRRMKNGEFTLLREDWTLTVYWQNEYNEAYRKE